MGALLWTGMVRVSAFGSKEGAPHPRITLLEDLRGTVPEFQPFSGNMLRFLPLLAPRIEEFDNSLVESGHLLIRLVGQPAFESLDGSPQRLSRDTDGHLENLQGEVRRGGRQPLHSM